MIMEEGRRKDTTDEDTMEDEWRVKVFHCPFGIVIRNHGEVVEYKGKTSHRPWTEEKKRDFIHERARRRNARKRQQKALLNETEQIDNAEIVFRFHRSSRAVQTHMMYFSLLSAHALEHGWHIGYESYQKRLTADDMEDVQSKLQRWLAKHGKGVMAAISIGRGKNGYVFVYALYTSDDEDKMIDFHVKLVQYMREGMKRKRKQRKDTPKSVGFKLIECRPYERDPEAFLASRYCRELKDVLDADDSLIDELAYVIRSSFILYGKEKTLKTIDAHDIVEAHGEVEYLFTNENTYDVTPAMLVRLHRAGSVVDGWRDSKEEALFEKEKEIASDDF